MKILSECGNVMSDALLIQTPQGTARVTLLINGNGKGIGNTNGN